MRVSISIASFVAVLAGCVAYTARAQAPQTAAGTAARPASAEPAGERPRATRPPLFIKEDWKQIPGVASIP